MVVCLIMIEIGLRVFHIRPLEIRNKECKPMKMWAMRRMDMNPPYTLYNPNISTNQIFYKCRDGECEEDLIIPLATNSDGFRDYEYTEEKPDNTIRIICLGDSFTAGDGVLLDDTFPKVLERTLNERYDDAPRFEVINTAVVSYTTLEEWYAFERKGLDFEPDIVVVGFYLNDVSPSSWRINELRKMGFRVPPPEEVGYQFPFSQLRLIGQKGRPGEHVSTVLVSIRYAQTFFIHKWIASIINSRRLVNDIKQYYFDLWNENVNRAGCLELEVAFDNMSRLQEESSVRFMVVVFPWLQYLNSGYPFEEIHEKIDILCNDRKLRTLQLLDIYRGLDDSVELWAHESDHHPSAELHHIAAKSISKQLMEEWDYYLPTRHAMLPE